MHKHKVNITNNKCFPIKHYQYFDIIHEIKNLMKQKLQLTKINNMKKYSPTLTFTRNLFACTLQKHIFAFTHT